MTSRKKISRAVAQRKSSPSDRTQKPPRRSSRPHRHLSFTPGDFTLASDQKSDYSIDCRITALHAEGGRLAGIVLLDLIPEAKAIGGLTMGAEPLVSNTSSASAWEAADHAEFLDLDPDEDHGPAPAPLHGFLVRKAEKTHRTGRCIEGFLKASAPVVIVDDVCTTGGSTITAIEATRDAGMNVIGVLCLFLILFDRL